MAQLVVDLSGSGGLAPRHRDDWFQQFKAGIYVQTRYVGKENQMAQGIWNPHGEPGYLWPSHTTTTTMTVDSGSVAAIVGSYVQDYINSDVYVAERGQKLFVLDGYSDTQLANTLDLGSTGSPVIMDLEIYQVNGVRKIFVVYEKADKTEIAISSLPYDTGSDDLTWLSATVSGTAGAETLVNDAFMRVADNGFAYLFRDNRVDKIDGTSSGGSNGTIFNNVLLFPTPFEITDALDYRGNMFIAIHHEKRLTRTAITASQFPSECGIYIWDRLSTVVNTRDYIPLQGVEKIMKIFIAPNGRLRIITQSFPNSVTEIREFNGSTFETIQELPLFSFPVFVDGLFTTPFGSYWMGENGVLYYYGTPHPGTQEGLYELYDPDFQNVGNIQAGIACIYGTSGNTGILFGDRVSNTFAVKHFKLTTGTNNAQGNVYSLVKFLPQMSTVSHIDVFMRPNGSSGSTVCGTLKTYFNQSTTAFASKSFTKDQSARGYARIEVNKPYINAVQFEVEWPTSQGPGRESFLPSYAVVHYEPTESKG